MQNKENGTKLKKRNTLAINICIRQAIMALNTQPSPSGDRPVPTKPLNTNFSGRNLAPSNPIVGH